MSSLVSDTSMQNRLCYLDILHSKADVTGHDTAVRHRCGRPVLSTINRCKIAYVNLTFGFISGAQSSRYLPQTNRRRVWAVNWSNPAFGSFKSEPLCFSPVLNETLTWKLFM